jgi:hypothetical protein
MIRSARRFTVLLIAASMVFAAALPVFAEGGLKTINNPGGGQIVYGPMDPQPSLQAAMGTMLHLVHGHYGEKPQVGRLVQDHAGKQLAAFFNLTDHNFGSGRIGGLVMVYMSQGSKPMAAVLTDTSQRFPQTVNSMLQRLNSEWRASMPASPGSGGGSAGSVSAAPLNQVNFPDGTGSVGLPAGWQMTAAHGGAFEAHGPNGEKLTFGIHLAAIDTSNPQVRQRVYQETQGGRVPMPGSYVVIPYNLDPGQAYIQAANQMAQKQRRQPPTLNITKVTQGAAQSGASVYVIEGDLDAHDGRGFVTLIAQVYRRAPYDAMGNWSMTTYQASIPKPLVSSEGATIAAIFRSYKMNEGAVVGQIQNQIAVSKAYTDAVMARTKASQDAFDQKLANDRANQDARDKVNQGFANILLDQTVVRDADNHVRGTVSNDYADALVKANPNRFQYVPTQDYLKGIDY